MLRSEKFTTQALQLCVKSSDKLRCRCGGPVEDCFAAGQIQ